MPAERGSLRYRNYAGGGQSLRVHKALMILALAIKMDNEEEKKRIGPWAKNHSGN